MALRYVLIALVLGVGSVLVSGCVAAVVGGAAAGAGAGTVAYIKGELRAMEPVSFDRAWSASKGALDSMDFVITEEDRDAVKGKLLALGVDNKKVRISLKRESAKVTRVNIRVGTFGDETVSRFILEKIRERY